MQNRYFGDVGDFGKYGLLRRICGVSAEDDGEALSLGVVWYLLDDQSHNEDGKHTTYLEKPEEYRDCDPGLFDGLRSLLDGPGPRAVSNIERSSLELLPHGTKYVNEPLAREGRSEWLSRAIEEVRDRDVVFLDPDIGFQPPSVRADSKSAVQYVLWKEAERFTESHQQQTLVFYHHLNRTKPWPDQIDEKIHEIGSRVAGGDAALPVLFKRGTGRVFFVVPSARHRDLVTSRVRSMAESPHWRRHLGIGAAKKRVRRAKVNGPVRVGTWSKQPWTPVFEPGQQDLPGGRLVAGVTETPIGRLTVVGICVPWSAAHVSGGRRDRERWQDHLDWLTKFADLAYARAPARTIVLGDFNQRIPRKFAPADVHGEFLKAFGGLRTATEGFFQSPFPVDNSGGPWHASLSDVASGGGTLQFIDHIAHSTDLVLAERPDRRVGVFPERVKPGDGLPDHFGVWVDLTLG